MGEKGARQSGMFGGNERTLIQIGFSANVVIEVGERSSWLAFTHGWRSITRLCELMHLENNRCSHTFFFYPRGRHSNGGILRSRAVSETSGFFVLPVACPVTALL